MDVIEVVRRRGLDLRPAHGDRGIPLAALSDSVTFARAVDMYAEHHEQMFATDVRRDISALWLLQDIAWAHAVLAVGMVRESGAAVYPVSGLAMHLPRTATFTLDLDLDDLEVVPVTDLHIAYGRGRRYLSTLLEPVVNASLTELRAGPRAAWACVTDASTSAISGDYQPLSLEAGLRLFTDPAARHEIGDEVDDQVHDQLLRGLQMVDSPSGIIRRRHGCCLLYAIQGMELCFSCPRS